MFYPVDLIPVYRICTRLSEVLCGWTVLLETHAVGLRTAGAVPGKYSYMTSHQSPPPPPFFRLLLSTLECDNVQ
jgi:hypothetical protein